MQTNSEAQAARRQQTLTISNTYIETFVKHFHSMFEERKDYHLLIAINKQWSRWVAVISHQRNACYTSPGTVFFPNIILMSVIVVQNWHSKNSATQWNMKKIKEEMHRKDNHSAENIYSASSTFHRAQSRIACVYGWVVDVQIQGGVRATLCEQR